MWGLGRGTEQRWDGGERLRRPVQNIPELVGQNRGQGEQSCGRALAMNMMEVSRACRQQCGHDSCAASEV